MKIYFVQVKDRWDKISPIFITTNKELAEKEKLQVDLNYQRNMQVEGETAWIDEKDIDNEVFYDYDWFNK